MKRGCEDERGGREGRDIKSKEREKIVKKKVNEDDHWAEN